VVKVDASIAASSSKHVLGDNIPEHTWKFQRHAQDRVVSVVF
jgi:hypothetical protein